MITTVNPATGDVVGTYDEPTNAELERETRQGPCDVSRLAR